MILGSYRGWQRLGKESGTSLCQGIEGTLMVEDIVLCKIYQKATSLKELEQRAAMEADARASQSCISAADTLSSSENEHFQKPLIVDENRVKAKEEELQKEEEQYVSLAPGSSVNLPEIQVPKHNMDWMQDPFLTQLRSPWLEQWSPLANMLNF
ncbi:hypothetical protein J5N97_024847 [Dioscorea zingiberensis]|uniref:Uncharacterized protein n=1 Tax=Dioscorea zingiberensis TaxID=325984 RepID=A0A9D5C879_9LILI|nr:hypothetical protein J5N97_024847 [Dioscorea zingiberensis]